MSFDYTHKGCTVCNDVNLKTRDNGLSVLTLNYKCKGGTVQNDVKLPHSAFRVCNDVKLYVQLLYSLEGCKTKATSEWTGRNYR